MTNKEYKQYIIRKITKEFSKKFYDKLGYIPTIKIIDDRLEDTIPLEELEKIINSFIPKHIKRKKNITNIIQHCRVRQVADLRHIFCYIAKQMGYTLYETGQFLSKRHHTSALNSIKKAAFLINNDEAFNDKYERIMAKINEYIENGNKLLHTADEESPESQSTLSTVLL